MNRILSVAAAATLMVACQAAPSSSIISPTPTQVAASPAATPSPAPTAAATPRVRVPSAVLAFMRSDADGIEHYFTINTDGTSETPLFSTQGCSCLAWSPDGNEIWAVSETDHGTLAFTTMEPDGTRRQVHEPEIQTLSLAPGAATHDGSLIAFNGWDDTDPSRNGIWVGSRDMSDLRQVTQLPEGASPTATAPLGITPDGSQILFFAETGKEDFVTHAGDLYVVDTAGGEPRVLNDETLHLSMVRGMPATLSPDGSRAAFAAFEGDAGAGRSAVFVVSLAGGEAERITDFTGGIWSAAWAPVGEVITFAKWTGESAVVSVVNSDGSELTDLSTDADAVGFGAWSPDGRYLLVARGEDESRRDLWIMDVEGRYVGQVTDSPATYGMYVWSPMEGT